MFTRTQNHVSKIWLLSLFGVLALNVSARPGSSSGSSDLSSISTNSDCLQLKLDAGELADCKLEYQIDGKTVKTTAHAKLITVKGKHLDRESGEYVEGKAEKTIEVTFSAASTECAFCEGGSSQAKLGKIDVQLKQLDDLHTKIDEMLAEEGGKLVSETKKNEAVQSEQLKKNAALKQQQDFCLRDAQGQSITDTKDRATCGIDHLRMLQDKNEAAAYYEIVVHPHLETLAKSDKVADRIFAKNMIDELAMDPSNAGNVVLNKSIAELRTFSKYEDTAHVLKEAIDSPVTQVQIKQQAQAQLTALKADWTKHFTTENNAIATSAVPDGFTPSTSKVILSGEIAGLADASGNRLTEGYERELDSLVDAHGDTISASPVANTGEGRTARGTVGLLPGIAAATTKALGTTKNKTPATATKHTPSPILVGDVSSIAPNVVPGSAGSSAVTASGFSGGLSARCLGCGVGSTTASGK